MITFQEILYENGRMKRPSRHDRRHHRIATKDDEQARTASGYVVGGLYYGRQGLKGWLLLLHQTLHVTILDAERAKSQSRRRRIAQLLRGQAERLARASAVDPPSPSTFARPLVGKLWPINTRANWKGWEVAGSSEQLLSGPQLKNGALGARTIALCMRGSSVLQLRATTT